MSSSMVADSMSGKIRLSYEAGRMNKSFVFLERQSGFYVLRQQYVALIGEFKEIWLTFFFRAILAMMTTRMTRTRRHGSRIKQNSSMMNFYKLLDRIHFHLNTNILFLKYLLILRLGNCDLIDASLLLEEEHDD